jgi:DNA mismatch endonuclease (patch repair protein)
MPDIVSRKRRSEMMSGIRASGTRPEVRVRSALHRAGLRFRLASGRSVFGKPDIVLPAHSTVVFVHGCFWHRHHGCRFAYAPKSNVAFWRHKFRANVARDAVVARELRRAGWKRVVLWACELSERRLSAVAGRIRRAGSRRMR